MSEALRQGLFLQTLAREMDCKLASTTITLFSDSQGAIALANNPISFKRNKHIDVKFHFIREHVQKGVLRLRYVGTQQMIADILTKQSGRQQFNLLAEQIMGEEAKPQDLLDGDRTDQSAPQKPDKCEGGCQDQ